jgi:hypothetical protein
MKKYWNYFIYVVEHKKNVFIECWKAGLYIHAFTHDLSKFRPSEFIPYAKKNEGGFKNKKSQSVEMNFSLAWLHHQNRNKHHWEYWMCRDGYSLPIPTLYIRQIICDWKAMGRKFDDTAQNYYEKNKSKIKLTPLTRELLEYGLKFDERDK